MPALYYTLFMFFSILASYLIPYVLTVYQEKKLLALLEVERAFELEKSILVTQRSQENKSF